MSNDQYKSASDVPPGLSDDPVVRLAECRGYVCKVDESCGQALAFEEEQERVKFEKWFLDKFYEGSEVCRGWLRREGGGYWYAHPSATWETWLACAKSRAEGK